MPPTLPLLAQCLVPLSPIHPRPSRCSFLFPKAAPRVLTRRPPLRAHPSNSNPHQSAVDLAECGPQLLLSEVSRCAKQNRGFLGCVSRGNPGPTRQCDCMEVNAEMESCLGRCFPAAVSSLCHLRWSPRE